MLHVLERMLVFPAPRLDCADWNPDDLPHEDVEFRAEDGTQLHGWFVPHESPRAAVLYSHGNGEHVARLAPRLKELHEATDVAVFAWDYRGYGKSQGKSTSELALTDAREAQLWLADRMEIPPKDVVLLGRSLGGGVSAGLASRHAVRGLVLERTFSRLKDAAAYHFPWLPVRWLMRNEFPSIDWIRDYHGPLFQSHGTEDEVVPYAMGQALFDACPSEAKRFYTVEGGNHNGPQPVEYYEQLGEWMDELSHREHSDAS